MERVKYLIIGNGIAGLSAAREIRNNDTEGSIIMVSSESFLTYYRVKLTESLTNGVNPDDILVSKENWYREKNIKVLLSKIVEEIDIDGNKIRLDDGEEIKYEKLLIATGSRSFIPPITGKYKEGVFALRTLKDLSYIRDYFSKCQSITIIGGGLLGLEAAWALKLLGKDVKIVEFAPYLLPRQLDKELGEKLRETLFNKGFDIYLASSALEILGDEKVTGIRLTGDREINTDGILVSSGIRPNLDLVMDTEIKFNKGILVDKHLKTNIDNIYAAGDVVEIDNIIVGLWTTGNEQGKIAGANMSGKEMEYYHPKLFSTLQIGDVKIFSAGNIENYDRVYEYRDDYDNIHHKLFTIDNKITGVILFGDLKDMNTLRNGVLNKKDVDEYLKDGIPFK